MYWLQFALHTFHKETPLNAKNPRPLFSVRAAEFYYRVGEIIGDTAMATEFICDNFKYLAQPPVNVLDEHYPAPHDQNDIATEIKKIVYAGGAKRQNYIDMADCFSLQSDFHTLYPPKISKIPDDTPFPFTPFSSAPTAAVAAKKPEQEQKPQTSKPLENTMPTTSPVPETAIGKPNQVSAVPPEKINMLSIFQTVEQAAELDQVIQTIGFDKITTLLNQMKEGGFETATAFQAKQEADRQEKIRQQQEAEQKRQQQKENIDEITSQWSIEEQLAYYAQKLAALTAGPK